MEKKQYDFCGWVTRNDLRCSDGRTIRKGAFKHCDGLKVPMVWNHQHNDSDNVLGHMLLENRDEGVYGYGYFNETPKAKNAKTQVLHRDITKMSIWANDLLQKKNPDGIDVLHGIIREVSLVLAGANPGAYIESVVVHSADGTPIVLEDEGILHTGMEFEIITHSEEKSEKENETMVEENQIVEHADDKTENDKTIKQVYDEMTEEQQAVVHFLVGQAIEDATKNNNDDNVEHNDSEGGDETMKHNVFDQTETKNDSVISHADQGAILALAKQSGVGSLKAAMEIYAEDNKDTLAHGIDQINELFPDYKDVHPGAPELLERDQSWVGLVMRKAHKSPISRVRMRQADARAAELRAKGYNNREEEKALSGNLKLLMRTFDPQTVYRRDELHRDDINDIVDFDVVAYQKVVMKHNLEEDIALAALIGDGREDTDPDKIHENHIRSIWNDDELYCIHADVDIAAAKAELQGTETGARFGDNYIYAEAILTAALYSREKYKGKGQVDFYCTPHLLNVMLLARDLNGRRIYDSKADLAKALNVGEIVTVEQFEGKTRVDDKGKTKKLLGIFVNMGNYTFGSTRGGELTNFEDFDIDFNKYKYLMETRLSGALTEVYSAIALEEPVA